MRETIGIVQRAERCKIEKIGLQHELIKNIENICISWQATSKTIRKPYVFFKNSEKPETGGQQSIGSGRVWFFNAFISLIERMLFLRGKNKAVPVNLNDNNIYQ